MPGHPAGNRGGGKSEEVIAGFGAGDVDDFPGRHPLGVAYVDLAHGEETRLLAQMKKEGIPGQAEAVESQAAQYRHDAPAHQLPPAPAAATARESLPRLRSITLDPGVAPPCFPGQRTVPPD